MFKIVFWFATLIFIYQQEEPTFTVVARSIPFIAIIAEASISSGFPVGESLLMVGDGWKKLMCQLVFVFGKKELYELVFVFV